MNKRWLIAIAAVLMQMMLGTAYAWSVFKQPLASFTGFNSSQLSTPFALIIFFLGVSAAFGGKFVDKAGARKVATIAAILFGVGTLITAIAAQNKNLLLLYIGYGVIAGIGNGLGYITPVAVLVRWFPDKRGLITGIAVMGFGLGGAFIALVAPLLISTYGIVNTFYILGFAYLTIMLICAQALNNPPKDWMSDYKPKNITKASDNDYDIKKATKTPQFYILWLVFFVNITSGVALLSNLSPFVQSNFGLTAAIAGVLVFATSVFNGLGRVFWSSLSDKIGRKTTFMIIIYSQIPILFLLPIIKNVAVFGILSCYLVACMGGGFATMPAFVADLFGTKNMGQIYGKYLLAWSAAGIIGTFLTELSANVWGSYSMAFYILGIVFLCIYIPLTHYLKPTEKDILK